MKTKVILPVMALLISLGSCSDDEAPSPVRQAKIMARNDARTIINRRWTDSLERAEALNVLTDSADARFVRTGHPELTATYDSILRSTVRTVLRRQKKKSNDRK